MVAIKTGEYFPLTGEYEVLCMSCSRVVSRETRAVLSELSCGLEQVFCFECDSVNTDLIPPLLKMPSGERLILFDPERNLFLLYEATENEEGYALTLSEASRLCLSSSPYLPLSEQETCEGGESA